MSKTAQGNIVAKVFCTLIPSSASRSSDCCCVSASVRHFKPLNMMGSIDSRKRFLVLPPRKGGTATICDHNTILALDCLVRDGFCKINRQEDRVHLSPDRVEGGF